MRNSTSALLLLCALAACDTTTEPHPRPPFLSEGQLIEDAAHLALREMARSDSLALLPVAIDRSLLASLHDALLAVQAAAHPAADSVSTLYPIRARGEARQFYVVADTAAAHFDPWRNGERITGLPALDSLTVGYDIELDHYTPLHALGWDMFVLNTSTPSNLHALGRRYESAPDVFHAEPNGIVGGASDIRAERDGDAWLLIYSVGWGDCPAGCIHWHHWTFRVGDDGAVKYRGSGGDPAPSPDE